MDLEIKD